jgi:hypothetical protein
MILSLDSLATCILVAIILMFFSMLLILLTLFNTFSNTYYGIIVLIVMVSIILFLIPTIVLSQASYIYPRMGYGYFANVNNALRHTQSLGRPLVMEKFTNIYNKKQPSLIVKPTDDNQLDYANSRPYLGLLKLYLPFKQDLEEHRFPENYKDNILIKRRAQLNDAFNKHYVFDFKILKKASKFDQLFEKGAIGAHIRFTGHYINKSVDFDSQIKAYTDYIDHSDYPYVFLATHLKDVEDIFRTKYGSRLIIYDHYRNPNKNSDWTSNNLNQVEEDTNVLIDMLMLAKCQEIVGGPSNVFYAALWYNPKLRFFIPDILKTVIAG